jgi:hypothetical protein
VRPSGIAGPTVVALPAPEAAPAAPPALPAPGLEEAAAGQRAGAREAELSAEVLALSWSRDELARELSRVEAERDALRARLDRDPALPGGGDLPDLLSP